LAQPALRKNCVAMSGENDETGSLTAQCASLIAPYEVC